MGHRLSKIYTRTGDQGTTGLGDGTRVEKDDARVEAFGDVDELNSTLGQLLTFDLPEIVADCLVEVQHTLFDLGGELCVPTRRAISAAYTEFLEHMLDEMNSELPPLKEFVLPGGAPAAALCHVARCVCRRAERRIVSLNKLDAVNPESLKYLNRLSDLLFVAARYINKHQGEPDVLWQPGRHELVP